MSIAPPSSPRDPAPAPAGEEPARASVEAGSAPPSAVASTTTLDAATPDEHPRLRAMIERARGSQPVGIAYPCDALALQAARQIADLGIARPLLIGPADAIESAAERAAIAIDDLEVVATAGGPRDAALHAALMARDGRVAALMKGSLHTDEMMSAIVSRDAGLRTARRISHVFVFDLPRYHKLLALADCVVNIAPTLADKRDILDNAIGALHRAGIARPKVGVLAAVETVNPAMPATLDAAALVAMAARGQIADALVDGPFGFDNAFSAEAARIKRIDSQVAGDADLLLVPDLQAGNMLYKAFNYVGGGDCAGLVLGAKVPVVLTSRADSPLSRIASVALAAIVAD